LRGLGVLNYESDKVSGEDFFLKKMFLKNKNMTVIDVGANIGNYSMKIMRIEPTSNVYSFEPHPNTFSKLAEASQKSGFEAFNLGCGDEKSKIRLYDYANCNGSSHASLFKEVIEKIHKSESKEILVNIIKLDDFVIEHNIDEVDLLKIDTEGNELNVLKGLGNHIKSKKVKVIHFEFNEMNVVSRTFFKDFYEFLEEYDFYRMLPDSLVSLGEYNSLFCEIFAFQNIVAIRKDVNIGI
jgi:FkbM family methyltransferase